MDKKFLQQLFHDHRVCPSCPTPEEVATFFTSLLGTLFADHTRLSFSTLHEFEGHIQQLQVALEKILDLGKSQSSSRAVARDFFDRLETIFSKLQEDVQAMYDGDPAAKNKGEIIKTYPGFYAIAAYRIAHELHSMGIQGIPRMITEHAHGKTGIDIHPAAAIGRHFCIDHGTGVVIGETAVLGDYVKLYQGVTLGALSVSKDDALKKRHPTLEDGVVVYAGATILGGNTVIGQGSIIGGNVWLTKSVPANSKIYYQAKMFRDNQEIDSVIYRNNEK